MMVRDEHVGPEADALAKGYALLSRYRRAEVDECSRGHLNDRAWSRRESHGSKAGVEKHVVAQLDAPQIFDHGASPSPRPQPNTVAEAQTERRGQATGRVLDPFPEHLQQGQTRALAAAAESFGFHEYRRGGGL